MEIKWIVLNTDWTEPSWEVTAAQTELSRPMRASPTSSTLAPRWSSATYLGTWISCALMGVLYISQEADKGYNGTLSRNVSCFTCRSERTSDRPPWPRRTSARPPWPRRTYARPPWSRRTSDQPVVVQTGSRAGPGALSDGPARRVVRRAGRRARGRTSEAQKWTDMYNLW